MEIVLYLVVLFVALLIIVVLVFLGILLYTLEALHNSVEQVRKPALDRFEIRPFVDMTDYDESDVNSILYQLFVEGKEFGQISTITDIHKAIGLILDAEELLWEDLEN